jgi:digeranylgeranylglycerophospholipid reductase
MSVERREIVIIGAGPGGSAAAHAGALTGVCPLLVEKDDSPGATNACGGFAGYAFRRKFELPDEVVDCVQSHLLLEIDGKQYVYGGRRPHYISFTRSRFDSYLAQRAVDAGAELLTSTRVTVIDAAARRLGMRNMRTGDEREVEADVVIFADGPRTLAADAFGIGHRPGPRTRTSIFLELEGTWGDGATSEIVLSTAFTRSYFWIFPKRDGVRVGVGGNPKGGPSPLYSRLNEFIERRDDLRGRTIRGKGGGLVPFDVSRELIADGAMVVGDAGGLVNPLTGGGIAFAIASGEIAGRVAAEAVMAHRTDRAFLSRYPQRFHRTPHHIWLTVLGLWRRRLERRPPAERPRAYARMLRQYMSFFHHARIFADFVLGSQATEAKRKM